ncbi:MAG: hypothetical protein WCH99_02445 [Verrucomicrobiota bacterium]
MNKPKTKKSPERSLVVAMVVCLVGGLISLSVPALIYLKGHQSLRVSPSATSVPVATYNGVADLAHWFMFSFMPMIGFSFLVIGYLIWKAYRLIVLAKEKDNADD